MSYDTAVESQSVPSRGGAISMEQHRRGRLLKQQLQLVARKTPDGKERKEIAVIPETLSFEKGFFLFIRAVQLLTQVLNFMPGITVISMDNYNVASRVIDGNFDDPRITDYELLLSNLQGLREGRTVQVPIYDFKCSTRVGFREVKVPKSRIVIIEGIYALSERLRPLLDLRVSITGGVHFDLVKRVLRDIDRSGQAPEEIIHQISETVYPMYKAFIEPDLQTAHIRIVNKFNPFSGFQDATYILKAPESDPAEAEARIRSVLSAEAVAGSESEETYDIYLLPPGEDKETCQSYLRMRNRDGRYSLMFEECVTDGPFVITPRITFEVSVRLLGGLMALGYEMAHILRRESRVFRDKQQHIVVKVDRLEQIKKTFMQHVIVKVDRLKQIKKTFMQVQDRKRVREITAQLGMEGRYSPAAVQGKDRKRVREIAAQLGMEGRYSPAHGCAGQGPEESQGDSGAVGHGGAVQPAVQGKDRKRVRDIAGQLGMEGRYSPRLYIEEIQLHNLTEEVQALSAESVLKERFRVADHLLPSGSPMGAPLSSSLTPPLVSSSWTLGHKFDQSVADHLLPSGSPRGGAPFSSSFESTQKQSGSPRGGAPFSSSFESTQKQSGSPRGGAPFSSSFESTQKQSGSPRGGAPFSSSFESTQKQSGSPRGGAPFSSSFESTQKQSGSPRGGAPFSSSFESTQKQSGSPRGGAPFSSSFESTQKQSGSPRGGAPFSSSFESTQKQSESPRGGAPFSSSFESTQKQSGSPRGGAPFSSSFESTQKQSGSPRGGAPFSSSFESTQKQSGSPRGGAPFSSSFESTQKQSGSPRGGAPFSSSFESTQKQSGSPRGGAPFSSSFESTQKQSGSPRGGAPFSSSFESTQKQSGSPRGGAPFSSSFESTQKQSGSPRGGAPFSSSFELTQKQSGSPRGGAPFSSSFESTQKQSGSPRGGAPFSSSFESTQKQSGSPRDAVWFLSLSVNPPLVSSSCRAFPVLPSPYLLALVLRLSLAVAPPLFLPPRCNWSKDQQGGRINASPDRLEASPSNAATSANDTPSRRHKREGDRERAGAGGRHADSTGEGGSSRRGGGGNGSGSGSRSRNMGHVGVGEEEGLEGGGSGEAGRVTSLVQSQERISEQLTLVTDRLDELLSRLDLVSAGSAGSGSGNGGVAGNGGSSNIQLSPATSALTSQLVSGGNGMLGGRNGSRGELAGPIDIGSGNGGERRNGGGGGGGGGGGSGGKGGSGGGGRLTPVSAAAAGGGVMGLVNGAAVGVSGNSQCYDVNAVNGVGSGAEGRGSAAPGSAAAALVVEVKEIASNQRRLASELDSLGRLLRDSLDSDGSSSARFRSSHPHLSHYSLSSSSASGWSLSRAATGIALPAIAACAVGVGVAVLVGVRRSG
ncbi:unnamed protein product [Closterium sp. NIES-64]|nr:unnamed protein product [Closterium sp. NIES-64]